MVRWVVLNIGREGNLISIFYQCWLSIDIKAPDQILSFHSSKIYLFSSKVASIMLIIWIKQSTLGNQIFKHYEIM